MKGQKNFILALVFALIVAIFAVFNVDAVEVNYLFGTGQAPLILIILGSVLMGGLIAGIFGTVRNYQLQRDNRALTEKLRQLGEDPERVTARKAEEDKNQTIEEERAK
ncbi:DUF1049 domain-containing protein [Pontibacillus sp. ALD_SL1]|uniref:LapA family protein n=1 Tax=Pontibacillus sp. ALD_SL1 TaxID=2777185 RepID=UPI001A97519C|nr:lipopolysaccharide assembly protein LapA domain-containing protein [Pontibacillus sp. ALD_SL1]QSS99073.1 DUF1049 domain-containing protein [Pontibacillus sp. ALD_SL1]